MKPYSLWYHSVFSLSINCQILNNTKTKFCIVVPFGMQEIQQN